MTTDLAYDPTNPKHPTYVPRLLDSVDQHRDEVDS